MSTSGARVRCSSSTTFSRSAKASPARMSRERSEATASTSAFNVLNRCPSQRSLVSNSRWL